MPLPYGARPCQAGTVVSKDVSVSVSVSVWVSGVGLGLGLGLGLMVGGRNRREQSW